MVFFYSLMFCGCLGLTLGAPLSDSKPTSTCGISPALDRYQNILNQQERIMGGVLSPPHFWPWLTAMILQESRDEGCTGEIVGDRWIITAKHCTAYMEKAYFVVGTNNDEDYPNSSKYRIKKWYAPSDSSDIVLVELSRKLKYGIDVAPICISRSFKAKPGDLAMVAGFGTLFIEYDGHERTGVDSEYTQYLHEGIVTVFNASECETVGEDDPERLICAGGINRGVMEGDSGGPIMGIKDSKFYLHGSVSGGGARRVGNDSLTVKELDGYSITNIHCDWIAETTNGEVKCEE